MHDINLEGDKFDKIVLYTSIREEGYVTVLQVLMSMKETNLP
jgi:hypothetical protein